jgi:hypothetical protein
MMRPLLTAIAFAVCGAATAKLPPLDDAAKAKAAEAAAKTAWQGKVDAYQLCKAQDRVVARTKGGVKVAGKDVKPVVATPAAAAPAAPVAAAAAPAGAASGTPVPNVAAAPVIPPCADPGPFAYVPPDQKSIETSGAHSPPGTATAPPGVNKPASEVAPAKPTTAGKKS